MSQARESLKGHWVVAVAVFGTYSLINIVLGNIEEVGWLVSILISGPFMLGTAIFSLALLRNQNSYYEQVFLGFKRFGTALSAYLLVMIFVILWAILLIVPGIIAAISYSMTFLIIADDAAIGPREAIKKSKRMMNGNKLKFFYLNLRFIGWALLALLTLGIGFLWLIPYIQITFAKFYEDIKNSEVPPPELVQAVS